MPRKSTKIVQEPAEHSASDEEPEIAPEPIMKKKPSKRVNGKAVKQATPPPSPVTDDEDQDMPEKPPKLTRSKKEKKPLSLWMTTLQEHGYMCKGATFKPTPKKGSPEYIAVRAAFDAKKAALSK